MSAPLNMPTKEGLLAWVDEVSVRDDLEPRRALLLHKFALYADAAIESWAKIDILMSRSRSCERQVRKMLREFEAAGYIVNTGRTHRLANSTRSVPLYAWAEYLARFDAVDNAAAIPARHAPIETHGGTAKLGMGAQGVPDKEQIEQTLSDESDARARELAFGKLFERIEAAFPRAGLGATFRDRARDALRLLLAEGVDGEALVEAARRYAADPKWKRKDLGLDHWLHDRRYRAWTADAVLAAAGREVAAPSAPAVRVAEAGEADQVAWRKAMGAMRAMMGETPFEAWLGRAYLGAVGGRFYAVAHGATACDWIRQNRWRQVLTAWGNAGGGGRPLELISKTEFETLAAREGAAAGAVGGGVVAGKV